MKTLRKPIYAFKRNGLTTTCTMQVDLQHVTELLNPALYIDASTAIKIYSTEQKQFYRELKHLGFTFVFNSIIIEASVIKHFTDEDNQEVANRYAKRKVFKLACHIVAIAINRVLEHRARETEKLENIAIKLQVMSKH